MDALHGALLECAGKVLPAGVKFLCQLRGGQGRVLIMGLQVSHRARDQYTGAAGCSGLSAAGGLRDEQHHLRDLRLKNGVPDRARQLQTLRHADEKPLEIPLAAGFAVQHGDLLQPACIFQVRAPAGGLP